MRPLLFQRSGVTIHSYPAMLYVGMVAGVVGGNVAARAAGMDPHRVLVATLVLLAPALIGARLLYVASNWRFYRQFPRQIWNRSEGGAAQYGGLALALPLSVPLTNALHISWGSFWDVAIFTILLGMIFARIGCLLNGCCAGRPFSSWLALNLPNATGVWVRRLPTQCLEGCWAVMLLVFAIEIRRKLPFPGAVFWVVVAGYAAGRLVLESMREPEPEPVWHGFNIHHGLSVVLILVSSAALSTHWPKF